MEFFIDHKNKFLYTQSEVIFRKSEVTHEMEETQALHQGFWSVVDESGVVDCGRHDHVLPHLDGVALA